MRRKMSIGVVILFCALSGCKDVSWSDIFTLKSLSTPKGDEMEDLKEQADKYEKQINERLEVSGRLGIVYRKLGEKHLEKKAWDQAIDALEKSAGYGSAGPAVFYSLGAAYANRAKDFSRKDDAKKAEYYYGKALSAEPDYHDARYGLGILLFYVADERDKAVEIMKGLTVRQKNYYPARFALARFYYETGKSHESLSAYEELYSDLEKLAGSPQIREYQTICKENIERLIKELAGK